MRTDLELKFELLQKAILALKEAKLQGKKQFQKIEDKIEHLFMTTLEMDYSAARSYIDAAKARI